MQVYISFLKICFWILFITEVGLILLFCMKLSSYKNKKNSLSVKISTSFSPKQNFFFNRLSLNQLEILSTEEPRLLYGKNLPHNIQGSVFQLEFQFQPSMKK